MTSKPSIARRLHPFGGCNQLLLQYRNLGIELLRYERDTRALGVGFNLERAEEAFRVGVSFVPTQVLESYLEDLLDTSVNEERLCLKRGAIRFSLLELCITLSLFTLLGAGCAWAAGTFPIIASAMGAMVVLSALVIFLPRHRVLRRMRFAHLLSREISRRRGNIGTATPLRSDEGNSREQLSSKFYAA